jgi:hypothetical protein
MAHPIYHARSSAKQFGGEASDYYALHTFFDHTKAHLATNLHRLILHNDFGIELCEQIYGVEYRRPSDGVFVPVQRIGRQHVTEDFGFLPTLQECLSNHPLQKATQRSSFMTPEEQRQRIAQRLGGKPDDYRELSMWFGQPAERLSNPHFFRMLGNSFGIFLAEARFGIGIIRPSDHKLLPTRYVAEALVLCTLGSIPTLAHFFQGMAIEAWMCKGARRLSNEFEDAGTPAKPGLDYQH